MKRWLSWIIVGLVVIAVGITIKLSADKPMDLKQTDEKSASPCFKEQAAEGINIGDCAPNFTLETLNQKKVELYDNEGKPTIVNFWASWCVPCLQEMPYFDDLYRKYKEKVRVLMVNATGSEASLDYVKNYLDFHRFSFPVLIDRNQTAMRKYQVNLIPVTYVIDEQGKIVDKVIGGITEKKLNQVVKKLLQNQP